MSVLHLQYNMSEITFSIRRDHWSENASQPWCADLFYTETGAKCCTAVLYGYKTRQSLVAAIRDLNYKADIVNN